MICLDTLKQELWELLEKSGKPVDHSKLVPVKVQAIGPHGTYWTTVYKKPNEVTDTDKVVGNNHLLSKNHPKYKAPSPAVNAQRAVPSDVKKKVDKFVDSKFGKDHKKLYDFCKQHNITVKDNPNDGIMYMRAKVALKEAVHFGGFNLDNPVPLTSAPKIPLTQQNATNTTPKKAKETISDATKQKGKSYFESIGKDDSVLATNLNSWGIAWKSSPHVGINHMRMLSALNTAIEGGFDPSNPNNNQTPTPQPKVDASALTVPSNATPRQRALIEHINKMTDKDAIDACARMGIVPEDDRAQDFIVNRLQVSMVGALSRSSTQVKQRIDQEWGKGVLSRLQAQMQDPTNGGKYTNNPEGFGRQLADTISIAGCKKNVIYEGFQTLANSFNMSVLTDPRGTLSTPIQNGSKGQNGGTQISSIIQGLNEAYSNHTTDDYPGFNSNMGYTGFDPDVYIARFEDDKGSHDGFCLYLDKISQSNSHNSAIKAAASDMKANYIELLDHCEGNPNLMSVVLSSNTWKDTPDPDYKPSDFGSVPLTNRPQAIAAVQQMDKTYKIVVDELRKRGYSNDDISKALQDTIHNDSLEDFHIGNDVINFRDVKSATNKPLLKKAECSWGGGSLLYSQAKFHSEVTNDPDLDNGIPSGCEEAWGYYKAAKQIQNFTPAQYVEAHKLSHKLFGLKMTKGGSDLDYSTVDTNKPWSIQGIGQTVNSQSATTDTVMTNMIMGHLHHSINTSIVQNITKNTQGQFNNSGADYAGNYSYYSGSLMSAPSDKRFTQLGNNPGNGNTYNAKQLSDKIQSQTAATPNYSDEYLSKVKSYYISSGKSPVGESFAKFYNKGIEPIMENPIKDVLYSVAQNISGNTPNMATKPKFNTQMAKKLNYVSFDFSHPSGKQPRFSSPKTSPAPPPVDDKAMLASRQKLYQAATCSLKTESKQRCQELQKEMSGEKFDYKDSSNAGFGARDETNPNMNAPRRPLHSGSKVAPEYNRTLVYNSPFFQVNNSTDEETFNETRGKLMSNGRDTMGSKPLELYQGLTYSAAAGHLRQDKDIISDTTASLGKGGYYAYKVGHAAGFVGGQRAKAAKVGIKSAVMSPASGIIGLATVIRGQNYSNKGQSDLNKNVSSLSGDHNSIPPLRDYELCTKAPGLAFTHHIVDVTVLNLGITGQKTTDGIVRASTKELIADANGVSINMTYKEDM